VHDAHPDAVHSVMVNGEFLQRNRTMPALDGLALIGLVS